MATVERFEDLRVWKEARSLTRDIYQISKNKPWSSDLGLQDQIRRASVSISSNIAEGFERDNKTELIQYLLIAKGSAGEVRSQLYTALDVGYINNDQFKDLSGRVEIISRMIARFIMELKKSRVKGLKHKQVKKKSLKEEIDEIMEEIKRDRLKKNK